MKYINESQQIYKNLKNKSILITGASGLIGSNLIHFLMKRNFKYSENIKIYALGRSKDKLLKKFKEYQFEENFEIVEQDITVPLEIKKKLDYVIHAASNADPIKMAQDPVGTMTANFIGLYNLLELFKNSSTRIVYISSGEIYGHWDGKVEKFTEEYCGKIDLKDSRSSYPESKRAAEVLCSSYKKQYQNNVVIVRPCHIYGPDFLQDDSRVIFQFIKNVLSDTDIVLKSLGLQKRSYCHIDDAVSGIIYAMILGESGESYNIANKNSNITIREMAEIIANLYKLKIKFEIPKKLELEGYSKIEQAILDATKLENLGWKPTFLFDSGIKETIEILKNNGEEKVANRSERF